MSDHKHTFNAKHVAIIGLGLIGGSIARGIYRAGFRGRLVGAVAGEGDVQQALRLGLVDDCHADVAAAVADADVVVVAVPPGALSEVLREVAAHAPSDAVITDTGSSKASVIEIARSLLGDGIARFVPGHPIAGTENSGIDAGFATLFNERRVILTPTAETGAAALDCVVALWRELGASVIEMDAAHHDEVLAATSHLPHVLAYTLVDTLAAMSEHQEVFAYAAGGFSDFTRIASSDPILWRDIVIANRRPVLDMLDAFMARLGDVRAAVAAGDGGALDDVFGRAKAARDTFAGPRQESRG
ncbi:prephenate dehydrogenase/arogenate dehydrogenase family protein [Salinisphaera sp. Q1T1-3]|uniref:prephenate dehydrogenase n=1 Tax=Salinisphaera sp. Q1T1-3 TaxID=2321229 RepID=UPI000E70AE98|nr:prephenate dehydrogenase/arogenate dehydrogenase family protein [Salinisphaera sp. Q1T1-3]RJS92684.1 prephenate dehydrogenase/arogenate dehydrogenase family protein [Salinisphaera sp. Q1T1-3]